MGGTALALQYGHRYSLDLGLFSKKPFDQNGREIYLQDKYAFNSTLKFKNTLMGFIDGVKVDLITHAYELVEPPIEEAGVRMASPIDIAAMKLNVISQSSKRQKDFYDIYFLLEHFSLSQMLAAYEVKDPRSSPMIAVRAFTYSEDIRFDVEPPILRKKGSFEKVTQRLEKAVYESDKIF